MNVFIQETSLINARSYIEEGVLLSRVTGKLTSFKRTRKILLRISKEN